MPPASPTVETEIDDLQLLARARRGDQAAFAALVRRHERLVHGYVRSRISNRNDLDDLCQEVFIRLYTGRDVPSGVGLRLWLLGIARNVLREHVRAVRRRREHAWTELCLELEEHSTDTEPEGRFDEWLAQLPACLDGLGPSARQAIDMYYIDNLAMRDLAVQLKRSEGAVKLLVHRARQALRRCLEGGLSGGAV
jgi:RNA polymerase sigma-70 factor (ECF subfamily)